MQGRWHARLSAISAQGRLTQRGLKVSHEKLEKGCIVEEKAISCRLDGRRWTHLGEDDSLQAGLRSQHDRLDPVPRLRAIFVDRGGIRNGKRGGQSRIFGLLPVGKNVR